MTKGVIARRVLGSGVALWALAGGLNAAAWAQTTPPPAEAAAEDDDDANDDILVTGSRIRQDPNASPLPLQIIRNEELLREGISSPEQFIQFLSSNGNGADNLASNADVVSGAQRGTNGLSAANLRGQGSSSTLVLLNGRRVAAHGLSGSAVDVNQIPFAAIERVEVLTDGASAIYGTDAVGGVINYITRTDYEGLGVQGFVDIPEAGGGEIYRVSAIAGWGDLDEDGFNIMGAVSYRMNAALRGDQRDFVNGNQPLRGLSIDTRGTPIATAFPTGANAIFAPGGSLLSGVTLLNAGSTVPANAGINILDLPGGAGCDSVDGGLAYDEALWANPGARFACAWDTGRAAVLQQPINTLTYYGRATVALGNHQIFAEITGSDADSAKRFSNNQYSGNTSTLPLYYPLNALTAATYNDVYDRIAAVFPQIGAPGNRTVGVGRYGLPISYRWRCIACGNRELETTTTTFRAALGAEGPLWAGWDYRVGGSYAQSESASTLGTGYHFRGTFVNAASAAASGVPGAVSGGLDPRAPTAPGASAPGIVGLLNSGLLNPFSLSQSAAALAGLQAISAEGTILYGGRYEVLQFDASISGDLFNLPAGAVQAAFGVDYRRETYGFNGSPAAVLGQPDIFNVPFDNVNALTDRNRRVIAAYGEVLIPLFNGFDVTLAGRVDDYTGFGSTINPKVAARWQVVDWLALRASYNTGFRVPTFNQIFNGVTQSPNPGNTLVDPTTCSLSGPNPTVPGCAAITPDTLSGGNLNLGPENAEQYNIGIILQPAPRWSASLDYWSIDVDDVIGSLTIRQLLDNIAFFPDRVTRTNGIITLLDLRADNVGSRRTRGLDLRFRGGFDLGGGALSFGLDGTYLLRKRERLTPTAPFANQIGVFTFAGDLGLRWRHNAFVTWADDIWTVSFSQIFRNGYRNQALPGIANGSVTRPDFNERVDDYVIYNLSIGARINEDYTMTLGVRNLFDTDPPFAISYDSNTGSGGSWEPRVADPRGRSFTVSVDARF
jgi:iron complex outermembrane receptor protein